MKIIKEVLQSIILGILFGLIYVLLEILWRGYSHWTMFIVGGLCGICIDLINEITPNMKLWKQCLLGASITILIEFMSGCILNLYLNLNIWDYSNLPFNILGQVCPQFFILWVILSVPCIYLGDFLRKILFEEE